MNRSKYLQDDSYELTVRSLPMVAALYGYTVKHLACGEIVADGIGRAGQTIRFIQHWDCA